MFPIYYAWATTLPKDKIHFANLVKALESTFKVTVYPNVNLYTIRHFDQAAIDRIRNNGKKILLEQRTQETLQFVTSSMVEA